MFMHRPRLNIMGAVAAALMASAHNPLVPLPWVDATGPRKFGNNRKRAETSKRTNVKAARLSRKRNEQRARGMKV